ncbi:hypothetical protein BG003_011845 [Podila horticola]|nr:hypothetical protein BG003_011845 [Podila horticola]
MLQALWTRVRSLGLTFLLGFLLCIFQSSESILVKLAGNRPEPHPASAKLLFLSELLKLLISYTLLSVERKELVGLARIFRKRCNGCKCSASSSTSTNEIKGHAFAPLQDEEEQRGKRLLNNNDEAEEEEDDDATLNQPQPSTTAFNFPPVLLFAVPGAIYFFNNNLTFILLSLMPAPTYVVLSNLKILTTGLFSYWFLHRMLTKPQWISLGILFFSTAISQVDLEKGLSLSISPQAFLLMILFCSLSAAASVFSEYVMKERFANESIHLQNMKLYMFGILFNGITYLLTPTAPTDSGPAGFWSDMAPIHFFIILAYASLGLVTSAIIKFSGSITKVYASSMSMFFAALVSWMLLSDQLTVLFFVGCFGCCYALHLYYSAPPPSPDAESLPTAMALTERDSTSSSSSSSGSSPTTLSSVKVDRSDYLSLDPLGDEEDEQGNSHNRQSGDSRR